MNETQFLTRYPCFPTREFALLTGRSVSSASRRLRQLAEADVLTPVTRGIWANPDHPQFTPAGAVGYLLGGEYGYVSFLTALHLHGVVSQIPAAIQVATTGHTRSLDSPIGHYEFLQLKPEFMQQGIEMTETNPPYNLAAPEKALLDTIYISVRRGKRFARLPELDADELETDRLWLLLAAHEYPKRIDSAIRRRLDELIVLWRH